MDPDVIRVPETRCLECGHTLDALGTLDGTPASPKPGEPVACIRCGAAMTFENGRLRPFTEAEIDDLLGDRETMADLARAVRNIHLLRHAQN